MSTIVRTKYEVVEGGTGATTASDARTNLSAAVSGANGDITSMTQIASIAGPAGVDINSGGDGSSLDLTAANATVATSSGGFLNIVSGNGNTTGAGGEIAISGGVGGASAGEGGHIFITAGAAGTGGVGGLVTISGGQGNNTVSGSVNLTGGNGPASGGGGAGKISIQGGSALSGVSNGGDVEIKPGAGFGGGVDGIVKIFKAGTALIYSLDTSALASSSKTLTLQNVSGTVYVSGGSDVAVADGGTGASTAEAARNSLSAVGVLSTTTGIDGTATGTTNLYTVPSGKTAIIIGAVVRLTAITGFTTVGIAGIGIAAGEDDIYTSQALTGLDATSEHFQYTALGTKASGAATNVIKFGIDTAYTATTATLAVDLIGYLI